MSAFGTVLVRMEGIITMPLENTKRLHVSLS